MGTRQSNKSRSAALVALAISCVLCAPAAAQEASQLVGVTIDGDSAPGVTRIQLEVEPMTSWSSYRGVDGALTLELAGTQPAADLQLPEATGSSVTGLSVDVDDRGATLVKIVDIDSEHEIIPTDTGLEVVFSSIDVAAQPEEVAPPAPEGTVPVAEAAEPMAEAAAESFEEVPPVDEMVPEPVEEVVDEVAGEIAATGAAAAAVQPRGTVDQPFEAEAATELAATQVLAVEASTSEGEASVYIRGDGSFRYSAFSLAEPDRFVIDLHGVLVGVSDPDVGIDEASVKQVRLGQFQDDPQPVARVVFDLWSADVPWVQPVADGLVVNFGTPPTEAAQADLPSPLPETMAPEPIAAEPMAPEPMTEPEASVDTTAAPVMSEEEAAVADVPEQEMPEPTFDEGDVIAEEMLAEPVPAPVEESASGATEAAYYNEQDLTVTTGDAEGEPNQLSGFEAREVAADTKYTGEPIDLSLQDTDVRDVLRSLAQISGLNLVIQPSVSGQVTVEFVQVPWDQALDQILKINNLGYEVEGNIMRVAPLSQLREEAEERQRLAQARAAAVPLTTVLQRISYARANDIARILAARGGIMSQRGSVVVDPRTNTLIIKELPAFIDTVLSVIENLDIPEPQVMIEARIIETTKRFTRTLGIDWGFSGVADAEHGNTTGLEFPNNVQADGGVSLLTGGRNGFIDLTLGNVLNTFNLDIALQAAENEGLINILSEPRVATLNNERATIQSGLQIPIQTVANNTVSVQFVNATLRLDVTPQVTADGTVLMEIRIQKREPQPALAVQGAQNAPIATKEASTRVIVRDGGTTVIGGIYEVSTDDGEDRVPGLGRTKGIGALFRNKRRTDQNEELLIFITPKVIRL